METTRASGGIAWVRSRPSWFWVLVVIVALFCIDLLLVLSGSGSIDPTDPLNHQPSSTIVGR